jgi:hypothetical protein
MGLLSYMWSITDKNVVTRHMIVPRYKILTVVFQRIEIFWDVTLCRQYFPALLRTTIPN